jgi:hypothetical protein
LLNERDQQVLLEAEEVLRRDDERLVRAFEAFARCGDVDQVVDPREVLHPRDVEELSSTYAYGYAGPSESRFARAFYRSCRTLFMVGFVVLLAVFFWVFREGDAVLRLLSVLVMLPVVCLLVVAVIVLDLDRER